MLEDEVGSVVIIDDELRNYFTQKIASSGSEGNVKVISPDEDSIPKDFNLTSVDENDRAFVKDAVNSLSDYLRLPIITDDFSSAKQRIAWKEKTVASVRSERGQDVATLFNNFIEGNKLRSNKITTALLPATALAHYVPSLGDIPELDEMVKFLTIFYPNEHSDDPWNDLSTDEKIEKVQELSRHIAGFLKHLAA